MNELLGELVGKTIDGFRICDEQYFEDKKSEFVRTFADERRSMVILGTLLVWLSNLLFVAGVISLIVLVLLGVATVLHMFPPETLLWFYDNMVWTGSFVVMIFSFALLFAVHSKAEKFREKTEFYSWHKKRLRITHEYTDLYHFIDDSLKKRLAKSRLRAWTDLYEYTYGSRRLLAVTIKWGEEDHVDLNPLETTLAIQYTK